MAVERRGVNTEIARQKPGLIYDADTVTLVGKYTDELSAHRARRQWVDLLNSYFLLERDRDYEMFVTSSLEESYFVLNCCFISACGRYAFWRLINHQAPEAEERLGGTVKSTSGKSTVGTVEEKRSSWVFSSLSDQIGEAEDQAGLINRIIKLFQ